MGVQGLTSLIKDNSHIYRDVQFRDSRLVVDGSNLSFHLYCTAGLDQTYGGDYAAYENLIERFVKALRGCGIQPYTVKNGVSIFQCDDHTDKKLETKKKRAKARIQTAHKNSQGWRNGAIMPLMCISLFRQTLVRLEVPVVRCFLEADREVAALASDWKCPVLSNDGDFYIFDLPAGLLPIPHFQWQKAAQRRYVPCKKYTASGFCSFYNIQRRVLPAFAVLAGNDYVKLEDMGVSLRLEHPVRAPNISWRRSHLEALLCWLGDFQEPQEALVAALKLMGEVSREKEAEVLQRLSVGMEEYQLPPSALGRFFTDGTVPPLPPKDQGLVPDWIRLPFTEGRLDKVILNVLRLRRVRLPSMVEHGRLTSSHLTSRPIRQEMYGLLLGEEEVEEYDREGLLLTSRVVRPVFALSVPLHQAELSQRVRVLMEALEVEPSCFQGVEPHLRLLVAVTCYWMQNASPTPDLELQHALLLGLVAAHTSTGRREYAPLFYTKTSTLQVKNKNATQSPVYFVAHAFNQWQSCVMVSMQLNQLLGFPLPEPQVIRLCGGKLFHQLVHRLWGGVHPELLLTRTPSSLELYRTLLAAVQQPQHRRTTHSLEDLTANLEQLNLPDKDKEAARSAAHQPKNPSI
uniref:Uncharacterized protein n=1 Tax=Myripristis murdjan TaxID=586833 RepID=A0A667Z4K3_9TELE